jgi:DNA-binding response OmpR family regulator
MVGQARKSILVVDDEPEVLAVLKLHLQKSSFEVKRFTDPILALKHFQQHTKDYDTVLSDIRMQGMNGFEFVREVRAADSDVKIFLMTAFEMHRSEFEKVLPSVKISGLIQKPMSMCEMVTVIEKNL